MFLRTNKHILLIAAVTLAAALTGALAVAGCGSQTADPGNTVEAGAPAETQPAPSLTAADLAMDTDTRMVFNANLPGSPATVTFDLTGPWDFSDGPGGTTLTVQYVSASQAPGHEAFPDATVATTYTWGSAIAAQAAMPAAASAGQYTLPSTSSTAGLGQSSSRSTTSRISPLPAGSAALQTGSATESAASAAAQTAAANQATAAARQYSSSQMPSTEYNFESMDPDAWKAYGVMGPGGLTQYSQPSQALIFPAAVGSSWTETFTRQQGDASTTVTETNTVLAYNKLTVPAGTFDAFLLQTRIEANDGQVTTEALDYMWLVPGIGRAAEIISKPGEKQDVFNQAYAFYRLRDY